MQIPVIFPTSWQGYELIDCGNFEKLEKFGSYILIRPEPQAVWGKRLSESEWENLAHARFVAFNSSSGNWEKIKPMPDEWVLNYQSKLLNMNFRLALTSFKHVGIFPEQAPNWEYIYESIQGFKGSEQPKILNLFAYTGGASLAAKAAGADVVHVDAVKQVISWSRQNMEISKLDNIRWAVEDARKFVKREVKRGKKYHGIILDPPAYGLGPNGERWKLENDIQEMMQDVAALLDSHQHFLILNTYSLGFSSLIINNLMKNLFGDVGIETGETALISRSGLTLPLGVYGRKLK